MGAGSKTVVEGTAGVYPEYQGTVNGRETPSHVKRAWRNYYGQKARCTNPNIREYQYYGAKGIRQEYTVRQFIQWYVNQPNLHSLKSPSVDRIDHAKNYSLDNIRLVERSENVRERNLRCGNPSVENHRPVVVFDENSLEPLMIVPSIEQAKCLTGIENTSISAICRKHPHRKAAGGFSFRYLEDTQYGTA